MPLGLVSYGSSDSEDSDNEQEDEKQDTPVSKTPNHKLEAVPITESGEISDEDDEVIPSVLGDEEITADIPGLSSSSSLLDSLPSVSKSSVPSTSKTFVDENEDLSTIPKAKIYSEKPDLKALKPKKKGPVRIMAPSLTSRYHSLSIKLTSNMTGLSPTPHRVFKLNLRGHFKPPPNAALSCYL